MYSSLEDIDPPHEEVTIWVNRTACVVWWRFANQLAAAAINRALRFLRQIQMKLFIGIIVSP
jgi:hypothetical protein